MNAASGERLLSSPLPSIFLSGDEIAKAVYPFWSTIHFLCSIDLSPLPLHFNASANQSLLLGTSVHLGRLCFQPLYQFSWEISLSSFLSVEGDSGKLVTTKPSILGCVPCRLSTPLPAKRLNFHIQVQDSIGEANFVLIGKIAEKLLGNTAQELLAQQTNKRELPPKFNELQKQNKLFTVTWGKKKFKVASPYYQVLQVSSVPATSHSTLEIEEPKAQPVTPPDDNQKNSSEQELKIAATAQKRKAKELFLEQPSKKMQTRTAASKGIEIKEEKE